MDASSRAELATLRVRAYGPGADIADDPVALARLEELEEMVRHEHELLTTEALEDAPAAPVEPVAATATAPEAPVATPPPAPRARRALLTIGSVAAAVAVGAVVVPAVAPGGDDVVSLQPTDPYDAYSLTRDEDAVTLFKIPLNSYFGSEEDADDIPPMAAGGELLWADSLGEYFGWTLWIGAADGALPRENCIALVRGDVVRSRCVPAALRSQSALVATLPYALIPEADRPDGMTSSQRIGFWWRTDLRLTVMLAENARL